jgi:uncharacterized iron-regulated protein
MPHPLRVAALLALLLAAAPAGAAELTDTQLAEADVVLLGEIHDDPAHHRRQAEILTRMAALGLAPTVVFEMIPTDLQEALERAVDDGAGADRLADVVGWEERGWGDFALYRPVIEAALGADLRIVGGDLPDALKRRIGRDGAATLEDWDRSRLGLDAPLDPAARSALEAALAEGHCGLLPADRLPAMVDVQRARDGSMAETIRKAAGFGPVVLIAGQGHVREDFGVPSVLARTASHLQVLSVALAADGSEPPGVFDVVLGTGAAPAREDPCASFRLPDRR